MKTITGKQVKITDSFWSDRMNLVYQKVIPYQWEALNDRIADAEPSHAIANFRIAAAITEGTLNQSEAKAKFQGCVFQDSDLAKWIEAAAFSLNWHPDTQLEQTVDDAIDLICRAQQPDGYLDTYYIINGLEKRFTNLTDNHELYCLGHFLEAGCAYYHATGKDKLLQALIRYVDLIDATFGPVPEKKKGYPGHEVIEMALIKLYEITKDEKHKNLAAYFVNQRGQEPLYFKQEAETYNNEFFWKDSLFQYAYYQAHKPVREQTEAIGHAVRAVYLYSGMADVARETGDEELKQTCRTLWDNIVKRQMYITGNIGSSSYGESFTFDYDLPNESIYGETCASIGLVFFAMRMLKLEARGIYADVMEKALYNGIISGISLDGTRFFYVNPLEVKPKAIRMDQRLRHVKGERQKWFGCACCPPNIARMMASLGDYIYTVQDNTLYQNLYIGSRMETEIEGQTVTAQVTTSYPWDEKVDIRISTSEGRPISYAFRLPGWCQKVTVRRNQQPATYTIKDGYAYLDAPVDNGDLLELTLSMPVTYMKADPRVRQNIGKTAVMRGPVVYCLEEEDNGPDLQAIHLASKKDVTTEYVPDLLGGIIKITLTGEKEDIEDSEALYYAAETQTRTEHRLTFIPYYAWSNRTPGEMKVWIND